MIHRTGAMRATLVSILALAGQCSLALAAPSLADFEALAAKQNLQLALPHYAVTVDELTQQVQSTLQKADADLTALAAQDPAKFTFENTFTAYDAIAARVSDVSQQVQTVAESSMDAKLRETANELVVKLQEWSVGLDYREDLYRALKTVADKGGKLGPQEERLVTEQMRTYRRAGLALPPAERSEVEKLRKQLAAMNTEFSVNVNEARGPVDFTADELAGVPASFLESPGIKQPDGRYRVMANVTWQATAIAENADHADTRRRVNVVRGQLAREKNIPLMAKLVALRADIARRLGYATWADYQTEIKMAKTGAAALKFEEELVAGLQPKFAEEMETLRHLKVEQTGDASAQLEAWDVSYYMNRLLKQKYSVDKEELRSYFPYQATLEGMFAIYQRIFGLKFTAVTPPYVWAPGVQLYVVQDADSEVPMGAFYLDMFPREGKYNHFACFGQKSGVKLPDGRYDLPVAALLCNFPAPSADKPSLLKHDDVETLFHEFGHVMHVMLGRSRYVAQTAFSVPQDFVEAPSQMLESWVWDKAVLDTFAADYRDPSKKIPADLIGRMVAARQATEGFLTRRQLALGLIDLALHAIPLDQAQAIDVTKATNDVFARVTLPPAPDTAFVAYFGHLTNGYDAGYYGYLWSKVIALDMASVFKASPQGFLDERVGHRLRNEVYGASNTRDVETSVAKFLERPRSQAAFLDYVGIKQR